MLMKFRLHLNKDIWFPLHCCNWDLPEMQGNTEGGRQCERGLEVDAKGDSSSVPL